MGITCPKCKSTNTVSESGGTMRCKNCSKVWSPRNIKKRNEKTDKKDKPFNIMEDTMLPEGLRTDF